MPTPLIKFGQVQAALLLQAYCKTHNITTIIEQHNDGAEVLVEDPAQVEDAVRLTKEFLAQPNDAKFQASAWESGELAQNSGPMFQGLVIENLSLWRQQWFTLLIVIVSTVLFVLMKLGFEADIYQSLRMQTLPELAANHQWWRIFAPNVMHAHAAHLLFNMAGWWFLAGMLERQFGYRTLIALFVASTLITNIIYTLFWGPFFVGLSGVLFSVFGYLWWIGRLRPEWGVVLPPSIIFMLLLSLALGFSGLLGDNISNAGHSLGLAVGIFAAFCMHFTAGSAKP
ncbi:MAG: rhomboid family intramembrane serine protease [Glaciecola sp.]